MRYSNSLLALLGLLCLVGAFASLARGNEPGQSGPKFWVTDIDENTTNQGLQDRLNSAGITRVSDVVVDNNEKTWIIGERLGTAKKFFVTDLNGRTNSGVENSLNSNGGPARVTHMFRDPRGKTWLIGEY